jgi:hypothetical protein
MISSHIHAQYKVEHHTYSDFWDDGEINVSFWILPLSTNDSPVEIRTLPYPNAPTKKEKIYPGETVEVVQSISRGDGHVFLRLADDRGWIDSLALERVKGYYVEEPRNYHYPHSQSDALNIFTGPSVLSDQLLKLSIKPGSVFQSCAIWTPCSSEDGSSDYPSSTAFVKLSSNRAWVAINTSIVERVLNSSKNSSNLFTL